MNKTIKSLAMVAIALFAGFGSASAQEDEGVELNKDMFHVWDGVTKDAMPTDEHVYMEWNVGAENPTANGAVILGTSTVAENIYADLHGSLW